MQLTINARSTVQLGQDHVSSRLSDEVIILNDQSGVYFGLGGVGVSIWELVQEPRSVASIQEALLEEYDVEPQRCEKDLVAILQEMASAGLIRIVNAPNA